MNPTKTQRILACRKYNPFSTSIDLYKSNKIHLVSEIRNECTDDLEINEIFDNEHFQELIIKFKIDLKRKKIIEDDYLKLNSEH